MPTLHFSYARSRSAIGDKGEATMANSQAVLAIVRAVRPRFRCTSIGNQLVPARATKLVRLSADVRLLDTAGIGMTSWRSRCTRPCSLVGTSYWPAEEQQTPSKVHTFLASQCTIEPPSTCMEPLGSAASSQVPRTLSKHASADTGPDAPEVGLDGWTALDEGYGFVYSDVSGNYHHQPR